MLKNIKVILFILAFWALIVPFCGAQTTIVDVRLHGGGTQSFEMASSISKTTIFLSKTD